MTLPTTAMVEIAAFAPSTVLRSAFCRVLLHRSSTRTCHTPSPPARRTSHHRPVIRACAPASHRESLRDQTLVVTTPLFYVNAPPHMGSAYPTIAADALTRFYRMAGANPVFVTGCDEHGEKIVAAAAATLPQRPPPQPPADPVPPVPAQHVQHFCDQTAAQFDDLWQRLSIKYDRFIRTTDPHHARIVRQFLDRVWNNGDIYKSVYDGLYCTGCEEYKVDSELIDGNICPIHLKPCTSRKEENYFFALSKYQDRLESFLEDNPNFVVPLERRNEVLGWVKSGVRDFSVSRANNPWGIPVPRDSSQTIYVWFDALLGYVSALLADMPDSDLDAALHHGWPADVHIIGKDILRFHAVYWPAMLMSAGLPLPRRVIGHGFITKDGMKMGKSLGNTLDPVQLIDTYGSDAVRFYFLRALDFGRDGDFSEQRFVDIVNADLANSMGNLLNRSLNLLRKNCDGCLPLSSAGLASHDVDAQEGALRQLAEHAAKEAFVSYEALDFIGACEAVLAISTEANAYIDRIAPWTKFKSDDPAEVDEAKRCIVNVLEASRIVAAGLSPVIPGITKKVYAALGLEDDYAEGLQWDDAMQWGLLKEGMTFAKPKPVFPRLEIASTAAATVA